MKMGLCVVPTSYSTNATVTIKQETGEEILWDSTISWLESSVKNGLEVPVNTGTVHVYCTSIDYSTILRFPPATKFCGTACTILWDSTFKYYFCRSACTVLYFIFVGLINQQDPLQQASYKGDV